MALRLHISAHNAKTGKRLVLAGDEGWNNGMHGALAGTHLVPMPRRQRKTATAVVQSYACSGYDDTGSEALVGGLYERHHHAVAVGRCQVKRSALRWQAGSR